MQKACVLLVVSLLSQAALAQSKTKWTIYYENSVHKLELENVNYLEGVKGYNDLPDYFNNFDAPNSSIFQFYIRDSLTNENSYTSHNPFRTLYFRNTYLGIGTNIYTSKYLDITHAAGLGLSLADIDFGTIRGRYKSEYLGSDSVAGTTTYYLQNQSISSYKKIRRFSLSYENTIKLKPLKWFHISMGARQQVHFKFVDHLYTKHSSFQDTVDFYPEYFLGVVDGGIVNLFSRIENINLYDKYKPTNLYDETKRKTTLQYDATLFLRPEFILGKAKKTSIYCHIGYTPINFYGKDFRPEENPIWYGLGFSRNL